MPTQAQREANMRLQAKKDRIVLWVDKDGTKPKYQAHAQAQNKSLNAYIIELIEKDMQASKQAPQAQPRNQLTTQA